MKTIEPVDFENDRIVDPDTPEAKTIASYLDGIARKVAPDWDWKNRPVAFLYSDSPFYLSTVMETKEGNPVIVIGEWLFKHTENEDQLAFIIGYQAERWFLKDQNKLNNSPKAQDAAADAGAAERMIKAGYNWRESIRLMRTLNGKIESNSLLVWGAIFFGIVSRRAIPDFGEKIKNIQLKLSHMTHSGEQGVDEILLGQRHLPDAVRVSLQRIRHVGWMEQQLPQDFGHLTTVQKANILRKLAPPQWGHGNPKYEARNNDYLQKLEKIKLTKGDNAARKALEELVTSFFNTRHRLRYEVYRSVDHTFERDPDNWHIFGPFTPLKEALESFCKAPTREERLAAALLLSDASYSLRSEFDASFSDYRKTIDTKNVTNVGYHLGWRKLSLDEVNLDVVMGDVAHYRKDRDERSANALIHAAWLAGAGNDARLWSLCGERKALKMATIWWEGLPQCRDAMHLNSNKYRVRAGMKPELHQSIMDYFANAAYQPASGNPLDGLGENIKPFMKKYGPVLARNLKPLPVKKKRGYWGNDDDDDQPKQEFEDIGFTFKQFSEALSFEVLLAQEQGNNARITSLQKAMQKWLNDKPIWRRNKQEYGHDPDWFSALGPEQESIRFVFGLDENTREASNLLFPFEARKTFLQQQGFFSNEGRESSYALLKGVFGEGIPSTFQKFLEHEQHIPGRSMDAGRLKRNYIKRYLLDNFHGLLSRPDDRAFIMQLIQPTTENGRDNGQFWGRSYVSSYFSAYGYLNSFVGAKIQEATPASGFASIFTGLPLREQVAVLSSMEHYDLWPDDSYRRSTTECFLRNLASLPSPQERQAVTEKLLFKDTIAVAKQKIERRIGIQDLDLNDGLINTWTEAVIAQHGPDNGTTGNYAENLKTIIGAAISRATPHNRHLMLEKLCDGIMAQGEICRFVSDQLKQKADDYYSSHLPVNGAAFLSRKSAEEPVLRRALVDYLSLPLDCDALGKIVVVLSGEYGDDLSQLERDKNKEPTRMFDPHTLLRDYHRYFQTLSLEHKAVLLDHILMPGSVVVQESEVPQAYIDMIDFVRKRLFPEDMEYADIVREFFGSYVKATPRYMQSVTLAAMLATRNEKSLNSRTGDKIATFLEYKGPLEVKAGQGAHSYPGDLSDDIRKPLGRLKARAQKRPRWEIVLQAEEVLPPFIREIAYYGEILGSASFNTALGVQFTYNGKEYDDVLLLQKENAQQRALNGAHFMRKAIEGCRGPFWQKNGEVLIDMIQEAKEMSIIETDLRFSFLQNVLAHEAYSHIDATVNFPTGEIYNIPVSAADMHGWGPTHMLIERKSGDLFNSKGLADDPMARKAVALCYFTIEMIRLLSGNTFDVDRHGAQMRVKKIRPGQYHAGLFDFGGMQLQKPTTQDKTMLARAMTSMMRDFTTGQDPIVSLNNFIKTEKGEGISGVKKARKALLALQDFAGELDTNDVLGSLLAVLQHPEVDTEFKDLLIKQAASHSGLKEQFGAASKLAGIPLVGSALGRIALNAVVAFGLKDKLPTIVVKRLDGERQSFPLYAMDNNLVGECSRPNVSPVNPLVHNVL